jgi:hypothetical protein
MYDEQNFRIKKIDDKGVLLLEYPDLRNEFNIAPAAEKIIDEDNQLYLIDQEQGVFIFFCFMFCFISLLQTLIIKYSYIFYLLLQKIYIIKIEGISSII